MSRRSSPLAAVPLLLLGLAGCGSEPLTADEVATRAEDALAEEVGLRPEISCSDDLAAEVGAETRCTLTAGGDAVEYGVTVTVTSVEGDEPALDVQVDDEPQG